MRTIRTVAVATAAVATLLLAGCGGVSELVDQVNETVGEENGGDASSEEGSPAVDIEGRMIDASVHYLGLEYTIGEMTVAGFDEQTGPAEVELVFDVTVVNPRSDAAHPGPRVALQWDEPDSDNVIEVNGRGDFRQVPANASASGEIIIPLSSSDLEVFDDASARLILGQSGHSAAQVPVGAGAELIDRFPVPQPGMVGQTLEQGGVTLTITAADVRWNYGNQHLEDGMVLLDMRYTLENDAGRQVCHHRGAGNNFSLTKSDGSGYVDERVSERCVADGQTLEVATGFVLDADYAGEYTFGWNLSIRFDEFSDEIPVTLAEGPGVPDSSR